jgi:hypothetical protein
MSNTVIIAGKEQQIAPLHALQVASFFDEMNVARKGEPVTATFTRSLRIIVQGLSNAENDLLAELPEDDAIAKLNQIASYTEVSPAFLTILNLTGLSLVQTTAVAETESSTIDAAA